MKKYIKIVIIVTMIATNIPSIFAKEIKESRSTHVYEISQGIPTKMEPNTRIKFISNNDFIIIDGNSNQLIDEEAFYQLDNYSLVGIEVQYAMDGLLYDVYNSPEIAKELYSSSNQNIQQRDIATDESGGRMRYVVSWGASRNSLYVSYTSGKVFGFGRATTFSDTVGQQNHILKKGDVATKLEFDNIDFGTDVMVTAENANGQEQTVTMLKKDAGGMPDAVVDIWKTGVEEWGYTWNSWFSMPGRVKIVHENTEGL